MANLDIKWLEEHIFARALSNNEQRILLDVLLLLHSGTVSLQYEKHGQAVRIAKLEAGAQLGDMAFFNHDIASATVKALETCEVYILPEKAMKHLMQDYKDLSHDLMKT